ncbi:DUF4383 domain-containing protein [Rubrobacter marinus]|uniref:DUF4383 domain-containing protein n=1 Tax=Rubrobacter marinus TaxID=2653852 RepID=A0A6G8PYA3_9ACTN|nr:DUF4383 domain-containing protein [Rubrobacter marinus]QIN79117.1 DUF4383 domain-containing protein [Rubrobacter marinus]
MAARTYAQVVGVVLILLGVVGLLLGDELFLGILNIDLVEDIVHLLSGGLLAYLGFGRTDDGTVRSVVGVVGVVYLLVGILGFIVPTLFGLIPNGYTIFDNIVHLALGVLALVVAGVPGRSSTARS